MDTESVSNIPQRRKTSYLFLGVGCFLLILASVIGVADNFPGIVALLLGALGVTMGIIYLFRGSGGRTPGQQLLYWTPRALCIVFAVFVAIFALDVFSEGRTFWEVLPALLAHLIPTFLIIIVLLVSWRHEWIGGTLFILLALLYIAMNWGRFPLSVYFIIAGPLLVIGVLFMLNWQHRGELHIARGRPAV